MNLFLRIPTLSHNESKEFKVNQSTASGKLLLAVATTALLAGCAIKPRPFSEEERKALVAEGRQSLFVGQAPLAAPVTLEEAMARALKYNLDYRVKIMEEAVAQRQLDLSSVDLLPKLTASAGYASRDNVLASSSQDIVSGNQSLVPSTSSERDSHRGDLSFSWNVLDFGVSYYGARQQADQVLAARERRRKVVHMLMQQTRMAYWQAAGAQRLESRIEPLLAETRKAIEDSKAIENERLQTPLNALNYQRELLDLVLQLEAIRNELQQAKPKLAALMNIAPGTEFQLAAPTDLQVPQLRLKSEDMEEVALSNRPELIEAAYKERIGLVETRKAMLRLLPGLQLQTGAHYDSNQFLVNNSWRDAGLQVGWNLLNLVNAGKIKRGAQAQYDLAREQRLAMNMAVLTQVHVAALDYAGRQQQYDLVRQSDDVRQRILTHTRNAVAANADGRLSEIRASTGALMSELRLYQSYAAMQGAYGQLVASLGLDPLPDSVGSHDVAALSQALQATEQHWLEQIDTRRAEAVQP